MREGQIIDFNYQGFKRWVVVNINESRATVVPLTGKNPDDPEEIFEEANPHATGISPNSLCDVLGRVKGRIVKRDPVMKSVAVVGKPTAKDRSVVPSVTKPAIKVSPAALPGIPMDECADPALATVLNATGDSLFSG